MADGRRPESALDRALAALDAGLQHSAEGGESLGDLTRCARCLREPRAEESEFCPGCRAYLLGDPGPWRGQEADAMVTDECGEPHCPVHGDGSGTLELVLLTPSGPITGAPTELTAEDVERLTGLVQELVPALLELGRQVPPELLDMAARLEEISLSGQALGLSEERCTQATDEEIERTRQRPDDFESLLDRVRDRLHHEGGACACASGVAVCPLAGRAPVRPLWQEEPPCA